MIGIVVLVAIVLALLAALEHSHRRNADPIAPGAPIGGRTRDDRDVARIKLDLLATSDQAEAPSRSSTLER